MTHSNDLLDHMEKIQDDYLVLVDKIPLEDKLMASREEDLTGLEPWEISKIARGALHNLPAGLEGHTESLFDVVYGAISEALDQRRR